MLQKKREEHLALRSSTNDDEKGRVERSEEKLEEIAEMSNEASKKNGAAIDDGLMGRAAKAKKLVDCMEGFTVEDPGVTCEVACDGDCCVGEDSCKGFTGSVAKDGSCDGENACREATIGVVSGGSCDGDKACREATIELVSGGSCKCFFEACYKAEIGVISGKSCVGR